MSRRGFRERFKKICGRFTITVQCFKSAKVCNRRPSKLTKGVLEVQKACLGPRASQFDTLDLILVFEQAF